MNQHLSAYPRNIPTLTGTLITQNILPNAVETAQDMDFTK